MQLPRIQTQSGSYLLLDLSDVHDFLDMFGLSWEADTDRKLFEQVLQLVVEHLSPLVSGLVLGPEVGFTALNNKDAGTGLLLTLETQTELLAVNEMPRIFPNWSITHVRNNYALLFTKLFYHPHGELVLEKKRLMAELHDACLYEQINSVLFLSLYPPDGQPASTEAFQESQLLAAKELQGSTDMLVLEYPHTALAAATLTAAIDVPWILRVPTNDYAMLKQALRISLEAGAKGISLSANNIFDPNIQPQISFAQDPEASLTQFKHYLETEARDRVLEITRIIDENRVDEV